MEALEANEFIVVCGLVGFFTFNLTNQFAFDIQEIFWVGIVHLLLCSESLEQAVWLQEAQKITDVVLTQILCSKEGTEELSNFTDLGFTQVFLLFLVKLW